ncbi:MFS transporter [Streptomyces sp. NPDC055632]
MFASLLLLAGTLGDRFGRRRALIGGLALFAAASLSATFADSATALIVLRAVMGLSAAFVMPATLSTITSTFPSEERARAVSVWAAVAGASAVLGLLASGAVLEAWSWRSVFWLNVVLAAVALIGAVTRVPESAQHGRRPVDAVGALLTVAGLGLLVYSIIEAPNHGWGSVRTLVVLVGFITWELRQSPSAPGSEAVPTRPPCRPDRSRSAAREVSATQEPAAITEHGQTVAVLVRPTDALELKELRALAAYRAPGAGRKRRCPAQWVPPPYLRRSRDMSYEII